MTRIHILILSFLASSCSRCTQKPPEPEPPARDAPVKTILEPEELVVTLDEPHTTQGGLSILVRSEGHSHDDEGGTSSDFTIEIKKGTEIHSVEYTYTDDDLVWYVEGLAHGYVYTVSMLYDLDEEGALSCPEDTDKNSKRRITLVPSKMEPLGKTEAKHTGRRLAYFVAKKIGCEGSRSTGALRTPGTYTYGKMLEKDDELISTCRLLVGVYTDTVFVSKEGKLWMEGPEGAIIPGGGGGRPEGWEKRPTVRFGHSRVTGALSLEDIRKVHRSHLNEVRDCYTLGLETTPALTGTVEVSYTIIADGTVQKASIHSSTLSNPQVEDCIVKASKLWTFPEPEPLPEFKDKVEVIAHIELEPPLEP